MPAWNETHYARAQEFTRLLAEALAAAPTPISAPSVPSVATTPAQPPTATAATLFKKIPWKK